MEACDTERILDLLTNAEIAQNYMLPDYAQREDAMPLAKRMIELSHEEKRVVTGIDLEGRIIGWINDTGIEGIWKVENPSLQNFRHIGIFLPYNFIHSTNCKYLYLVV